jgi:hypothetical protein
MDAILEYGFVNAYFHHEYRTEVERDYVSVICEL